jgi:hypothetical protein
MQDIVQLSFCTSNLKLNDETLKIDGPVVVSEKTCLKIYAGRDLA